MKIPTRWLAEHLELPHDLTTGVFPQALIDLGHEVTDVVELEEITGPLVIGRVSSIEELTEFAKPIRYCQVEVSDDGDELGIICGARNFAEGELVVVALPGAVLPGGFAIGSRKTYGRVSEGMICSVRELGIGSDHDGILVLPAGFAEAGDDAVELLGLTDTVLDLEITPDRGYALSVRGLSRELSCALDVPFGDPAGLAVFQADGQAWPVTLQEQAQCQRFAAIRITGLDATAPTPWWMRRRLMLSGVRSIALAVDVTNYVMLEVGQPLHAYDAGKLTGAITVRRAVEGERLRTLDGVVRELDPDDVCVCDESGPIGLAGVMGGASTEIDEDSSDVLLEAAVWDPASVARTARRHKLPSEASRRFERGVDNQLPPAALELCAQLLARLGDSQTERGRTDVGDPHRPDPIGMQMDLPDRTAGVWYKRGVTAGHLTKIGCAIEVSTSDNGRPFVTAVPPSWRPDLRQPVDLV
ncbi:MAG: phenylalanine--tRNA ligase subunit beta, partial [Sciscionella sp.]